MRQRAAFLRTLLLDRDLLLLDEPFGALDALTRSEMQEWLLGIWEATRPTVLFITHDVDEALLLSDRIYVLGARPATVRASIRVSFSRPRHLDLVTSAEFGALKARLLSLLRPAVRDEMAADLVWVASRSERAGPPGRDGRT
jgi:ABC-type nitrate/sulfonate/bicarbonate transport system ATPase subunit